MPLGWAGRVRERTPQEARWKGSREGREWCVRRRWGDGKGQRRDAVRQKDGWKERRQRRPIGGETHHLWMTLQARCLSQQCTSPLTLYIAHSEHGAGCTGPWSTETLTFWVEMNPSFLGSELLWRYVLYTKHNCSICILGRSLLATIYLVICETVKLTSTRC